MAYQKVLQLYRSTNIWDTKNQAKAMVETNAKAFHPEQSTTENSLRDGEPILARFYDKADGYTFAYNSTALSGDPYAATNSANHVWVDGFDSFATMPAPSSVNYDSAYYIRVGSGSSWQYYKLDITAPTTVPSRSISSIFGVVFNNTSSMYIEWFDSAAEAQGVIDSLNYTDKDLNQGFVSAVHQTKGKVLSIHGDITSDQAIKVTDNHYAYVKLADGSSIPSDYLWIDNVNRSTTLPTNDVNVNSPKYYNVTSGDNTGYWELRKNIDVSLVINDSNNILAQGAVYSWTLLDNAPDHTFVNGETFTQIPAVNSSSPEYIRVGTGDSDYRYYQRTASNEHSGLSTNLNLRSLSTDEVAALGVNVKEAYKLVGTANGTEKQIGDTIKIYKDSSLYKSYLGTTGDTIENMYAWKNGSTIKYTTKNPSTRITTSDHTYTAGNDNTYTESSDVISEVDTTNKTITISSEKYTYVGSADPWIHPATIYTKWVNGNNAVYTEGTTLPVAGTTSYYANPGDTTAAGTVYAVNTDNTITLTEGGVEYAQSDIVPSEALVLIYYKVNDTYEMVKIDLESFLQENEFKDGLDVDATNHTVKVKLASDAGIEFKPEAAGSNKSLRIFIDTTDKNKGYRVATAAEISAGTGLYSYDPTTNTYNAKSASDPQGTTYYVYDTYLHTTETGLAVDKDVINNNIGKALKVNGEGFVMNPSTGRSEATVTGTDIKIAGNESTKEPSVKVKVKDCGDGPVSNLPSTKQTEGTSGQSDYYEYDYIEYNGLIYKWNSSTEGGHTPSYELYNFDKDTNLNEAISILEYMAYSLDMGTFTVA